MASSKYAHYRKGQPNFANALSLISRTNPVLCNKLETLLTHGLLRLISEPIFIQSANQTPEFHPASTPALLVNFYALFKFQSPPTDSHQQHKQP